MYTAAVDGWLRSRAYQLRLMDSGGILILQWIRPTAIRLIGIGGLALCVEAALRKAHSFLRSIRFHQPIRRAMKWTPSSYGVNAPD